MNPTYIMAETESTHWWYRARRTILARTIAALQLPAGAKILDVGCGTGGNFEMLAQFGEVSAFEIDDTTRQLALKKTNSRHDIRAGYCPAHIPFVKERFDLICLFDVLICIEQDAEALVSLKRLLNKNGRILITVPAYQWLYGSHDKFVHNKQRYSAKQLQRVIEKTDLKQIRMTYFNTVLFPLAVLMRLKEKLLGNHHPSPGLDMPPRLINNLFFNIFQSEKFLLNHFNLPFGLSLLCVLQQ